MTGGRRPILAPLSGSLRPLSAVPDPVFSGGMMGPGIAIEPDGDVAVAPVDGVLAVLHSAGHAFGIQTPDGLEILVHIGLDTVNLKGRGFSIVRTRGEHVTAGEPIVRFDRAAIQREGYQTVSPVVFPSVPQNAALTFVETSQVSAGEVLGWLVRQ